MQITISIVLLRTIVFPLLLIISSTTWATDETNSLINWQEWSAESFQKAKKENKLVIMDLEAVWCHWCHVMDAKTYHDPEIAKLINEHFIPIRVDQDAHPDISNRYEDYGWPATVIFDANGKEIIKRRGYIGPKFMGWFLQAVIAEPTPEAHDNKQTFVAASESAFLSKQQKDLLNSRYEFINDKKNAGWGRRQKFIHSDSFEYAIARAAQGSKKHEKMAKDALDAARVLIDPVWGGVYQYSDEADWLSPHFEKVMLIQTDSLRLYSMAYNLWGRDEDLQSALQIYNYLTQLLQSPEGVFYTSQDADLNAEVDGHAYFPLKNKERRKLGMPRIDKNIYARENGWVISALISLYSATGEAKYLDKGIVAANWIIKNRSSIISSISSNTSNTKDGGFIHDANKPDTLFLADTLAMGQAFLDLYSVTSNKDWLKRASSASDFISNNFKDKEGGFSTRTTAADNLLLTPVKHINSQILAARFGNLLNHYTGRKADKDLAENAMRYLASPDLTKQRRLLAGVLLADMELANDPIHITIVGDKSNEQAKALFNAGVRYPAEYMRIELWDKNEGNLPNPNVSYPTLSKPAAFACSNNACSSPIFDKNKISGVVNSLLRF